MAPGREFATESIWNRYSAKQCVGYEEKLGEIKPEREMGTRLEIQRGDHGITKGPESC